MLMEDSSVVRLPGHKVSLSVAQQKEVDEFLAQLGNNPHSPQVDIMPNKDLINQLIEQKKVVKISENIIFLEGVYEEMVNRISNHIRETGKITVGEVRDMFSTSRKYAVTLLEYMDEKKITRRIGDARVLR
jgi:selenocysteine-specific elongation factor